MDDFFNMLQGGIAALNRNEIAKKSRLRTIKKAKGGKAQMTTEELACYEKLYRTEWMKEAASYDSTQTPRWCTSGTFAKRRNALPVNIRDDTQVQVTNPQMRNHYC